MDSPIREWLKTKDLTQGQLALMTGVDRTAVTRAINGQQKMPAKMREYLQTNAPRVLASHERHLVNMIRDLRKRVEIA